MSNSDFSATKLAPGKAIYAEEHVELPHVDVVNFSNGDNKAVASDLVVIEEPLEIIINVNEPGENGRIVRRDRNLAITMRTPGEDYYLVAGFLFNEGLITKASQIVTMQHWGPKVGSLNIANTVKVMLDSTAILTDEKFNRHFFSNSSCGICGKSSLEAMAINPPFLVDGSALQLNSDILYQLNNRIREQQRRFKKTGAIHASCLLDCDGNILTLMEDVGRHNAMDKLVGRNLLEDKLPLKNTIVYFSGRLSFELVQKAVMAGIPFVASVGAPTNSAIELAKEHDITVVGFLKSDRFNVYNAANRIH